MRALLERLKEPSTYAGLAGIAVIFGIEAQEWQTIANSVAGVFGFIAVLIGE